jgi:hypothetical protein
MNYMPVRDPECFEQFLDTLSDRSLRLVFLKETL